MNINELRAQMARHGDNNSTLAKALGKSATTVSYKISGKRAFDLAEVQFIIDRYHLNAEEIQTIFFAPKVP